MLRVSAILQEYSKNSITQKIFMGDLLFPLGIYYCL